MKRIFFLVALAAAVLGVPVAAQAQSDTASTRPPFRLDQLVGQSAHSFICNPTGSTPATLQACTLAGYFSWSGTTLNINTFVGDSGSGGIAGLVPAPAAGDGAAGKFLNALGGWSVPPGGGGGGGGTPGGANFSIQYNNSSAFGGIATGTTAQVLHGGTPGTFGAVANGDMATMAAHTFKCNNTGSTGTPGDCTATQATAELSVYTPDSGSGGVKGLVPAPAAGDAALGKRLDPGGTWSIPNTGLSITGTHNLVLSDNTKTLWANDTTAATLALGAATTTPNVVGATDTGTCIGDRSGHGFTITQASGSFYGMPLVSGTSYTFSPGSFVCASSNGTSWGLVGVHGNSGASGADTVEVSITAIGTDQSGCRALTAQQSRIQTSTATSAPFNVVCLPAPTQGGHAYVVNRSANTIQICPSTGKQINSKTVTTGCSELAADNTAHFISQSTSAWDSVP